MNKKRLLSETLLNDNSLAGALYNRGTEDEVTCALPVFRECCYKCLRPVSSCHCRQIIPLSTRTRFVILMHPKEYKYQKLGTGRLTHLALSGSSLLSGVDFTDDPTLNALLRNKRYSPHLLYPGTAALNISAGELPQVPSDRQLLVIIIDGTWACSRKVLHLSANLHDLPRLVINPGSPSRFTFKRQPKPHYIATIEAAYLLLSALADSGLENPDPRRKLLLDLLDALVSFQEHCRHIRRDSSYRHN